VSEGVVSSSVAPGAVRKRGHGRVAPRARGWVARARTIPRPLAALLAVAAIQVVAWVLVMPPFQGPDEEGHFAYVQHLAETGEPPERATGNGRAVSAEQDEAMKWANLRALRGVLGARPGWSQAEQQRWDEVEASLGADASANGDGPNAVAQNPPLYYALEAIPYHVSPGGSFFDRFYGVRLGSALIYLASIAVMWLIASELFRPLWARTLATAMVALQPKLAMLGASVNADILLVFVWTLFIYLGLRIIRHGPTTRRLAGAGLAAAASLLTHGRGLAILPALLCLLVIAYLRWRPSAREALRGGALCLGIALLGLLVLAVFTSGVSTTGGAVYGGEIGRLSERGVNLREFLSYLWQFYLPKLAFMQPSIGPDYGFREVYIQTFYGDFASLEVQFPRFVTDLLLVGTVLLLIGLYTVAVTRLDAIRRSWPVIAFLVLTGLSMIALLHVTAYRSMLFTPTDPLFTGRYLLPLISLLAIAVTTVVMALPRRLAAVAMGGLVAVGVTLSLSGLGMAFVRFYA
jgi:4-amino-4-deoxy-L-arabinose transferase-like glycosyltransferase